MSPSPAAETATSPTSGRGDNAGGGPLCHSGALRIWSRAPRCGRGMVPRRAAAESVAGVRPQKIIFRCANFPVFQTGTTARIVSC
jgi:hypothetical protein